MQRSTCIFDKVVTVRFANHNLFDALLTWKEISGGDPGIFGQEDST